MTAIAVNVARVRDARTVGGFVILARFRVAPARRQEFPVLAGRNAAASAAHEQGCQRFDVLTDPDGASDDVVLYEIYDSEDAFDAISSPRTSRLSRLQPGTWRSPRRSSG